MERWYQKEAITAVFAYLRVNKKAANPLVVAPTGSGKSWIISGICKRIYEKYFGYNVVLLSHVKEILEQDYEKLVAQIAPELVGIYSASLQQREIRQFTVAGIQSVYKNPGLFKNVKLFIVDEAHTIPPGSEGMYRTFLANFPGVPILGLTATPFRLGSGYLTDEGHIFNETVYSVNLKRLIAEGFLCKLHSKAAKKQIDTSKLKLQAGDYSKKSMSEHIDRFNITNTICEELAKYKDSRKHWLVFAVDIKHAEHIVEALSKQGISAAPYHSKMTKTDRELFMRLYKQKRIQCIVNVNALTTGFDFPEIDLIGLLRPTKSPVLHIQMIGRGLRIAPEKENTLILDFAGNLQRLGPIDKVDIVPPKKKGKGNGQPPTKVCPQCDEVVPLSVRQCDCCGWTFETESKLTLAASALAVVSTDEAQALTLYVKHAYYYKHIKEDKPPSLKVVYVCNNIKLYTEWILFEHGNGLLGPTRTWWSRRTDLPLPATVDEALEIAQKSLLRIPTKIIVDISNKYPKITHYIFEGNKVNEQAV